MDFVIELLSGPLGVLLGVALGAVLTFLGSWRMARATRDAAREAADASFRVTSIEQEGERRIRMDDRTYADRRALVDALLEHLARHELRRPATGALDWDAERVVVDFEAEGRAIVSRMKAVFPSSVTDPATSAVNAAVKAARARSNAARKLRSDSSIEDGLIKPNVAMLDASDAYARARDAFLAEVQKVMTRLDEAAR